MSRIGATISAQQVGRAKKSSFSQNVIEGTLSMTFSAGSGPSLSASTIPFVYVTIRY